MRRTASIVLGLLLVLPGGARAQAGVAPTAQEDGPPAGCGSGDGKEVVVCGKRERSPYRIDPLTLDVLRSKEAANNPTRVQDRSGDPQLCGTVRNECGGGTIPLLEPALRVASAVVKAANGEDWREAFRNGPSDYDRYQEAKRKRAKPSISIGITAGN